jgi:acyl carrier protein
MAPTLEFDEFVASLVARLAEVLAFNPRELTAASGLYDEVGLDSVDAVEVVLKIEELAGSHEPSIDLPQLLTLGDAYDYYVDVVRSTSG